MKFTKCFEKCLRVGIWLAVFAAGYLTMFPVTVYSADSEVDYTYIPDDRVGDIRVYLDDLRFLRGSWKGVNLIHKWGEMNSPWQFGGHLWGSHHNYYPDKKTIKDKIKANYVADIPVRVVRSEAGVEYFWSHSYIQSDYRGNYNLPKESDYLHLQSDFKQMNRLEVKKDRITLTTTMKFTKAPGHKVYFNPILFPGRGKNRKYVREFRILGTKCLVIDKDGKSETVIYPEEIESKIWLDNEPRSLIFDLEDTGKIRYNFSFSDPDASLLFYAHTGWPTPSLKTYCVPAIVGKIVIPVKKNFKDGTYECSMKMEVVVGDAVTDEPGVEPPAELPVDRYLDVRVESGKTSHRFFVDDAIKFHIVADGLKDGRKRDLSVVARVLDYGNKEISRQKLGFSLPDDADKPLELSIPSMGKGAFILDVKILENNKVVGFKAQRFCVIDHPFEYPAEKSFFGSMNGWFGHGGNSSDEKYLSEVRDTVSLLWDIGIKKLRWMEHWTISWSKVEKERGKYVFPEKFYKLDVAKEVGMDCFLASGSFGGLPEWASTGEPHKWIPAIKDFKDFENYCCELTKRYKGLINTLELENEANIARYESSEEREEHIRERAKWLSTAYRGIKRADPDALVVGGTIYIGGQMKNMEWLDDLLEYAESKNWKLFDIMAPHYLLKPVPPEDRLGIIKYARQIADKYELILWNGENGEQQDPFHNIYPNYRFIKKEKDFANWTIRDYLIEKSYGVEHINSCHGCEWVPPWKVHLFEYESSQAGRLYGMGGFLKPWAVAHSTLAQLLEGSDFEERIDLKYQDAWCMVYTRGSQTMAAVWMKEGKAKWNIALPKGTEYRNIVGTSKKIGGKQRFTLTEEPFYLVAQGRAGAQLAKALKESTLQAEKVIEIEKSRFTSGNKVLEVDVRNYWGIPLVIERARIKHEDGEVVLEDVKIAGEKVTPVRFDLKKQLNPNGIWVDIEMDVEGKKFRREVFVAYRPATVEKAVADGYLVAVPAKGAVKVDGDLGEWKQAVPIELNSRSQVICDELKVEDLGGWRGPEDLSGTGYVMWDEENFYFACRVTDDVYQNPFTDGASSTWNCDSIQMAFDPLMTGKKDDRYYTDGHQEINLSLNPKGPAYHGRAFGTKYSDRIKRDASGQIPGAKLAVKKWAKGLIYEFSMPLGELYPLKVRPGTVTRFNFIINDDDGRGRDMWIGITPGIGEKKRPALFRKLIFLE